MLEHPALLLRRPLGPRGQRAIVAADGGAPLGLARRPPGPGWWPWRREVLAVHEHEDEPLLCTVRRAWGLFPQYEVRDADGRVVGRVVRGQVRNAYGRRLAALTPEGDFRAPDGRSLARLQRAADGLRMTYDPATEAEPFVRMLLLAAALLVRAGE